MSCKVNNEVLSLAYRLKKCPSPPDVENAEVSYEDEDFQIGNDVHPVASVCVPNFTNMLQAPKNH